MKFLRNPGWVAVILSALAIIVTLALYFNSRPVKKLRVEILSNSPLVSVNTAMAKEMQILYKGKPVQTLSLILLKVTNTGTEPIQESDYSEPIRVTMAQGASIGEVTVQETRPDAIPLLPTVSAPNQVALGKFLLNPGDQAVLRILALNNDLTLDITARIVGVRALDIQSVFDESTRTEKVVVTPSVFWGTFIIILVSILLPLLTWDSRSVVEWRRKRFGLDPARHFYSQAQAAMLTLPATKEPATVLSSVIRYLDKAFSWDVAYVERSKNDPLFAQVLGYEKFKDVIAKYKDKARTSDGSS